MEEEPKKEEEQKKKRSKKKLPVEVNEEEFTKLVEVTESMHHKIGFMLAWECGLRVSEVINLQPEDIDVERQQIRVNEGKGGKDRIVPLPLDWKKHHIDYIPLKCGVRALQKAFEIYAERAGITENKPTVHFHSLRHGFATELCRSGVKVPLIQLLLGHSDLSTTSVYLRLTPDEALEAYRTHFCKRRKKVIA